MIPFLLKRRLLDLSRHLNPIHRGGFIRTVVHRLDDIAVSYPRTCVYSCAGYCIGQIIDAVTGVPLGLLGLLTGGLFGLHRDLQRDIIQQEVSRVIEEELRRYTDFEI